MSAEIYDNDLAVYAEMAWHRAGHVHGRPLNWDAYRELVRWPQAHRVDLYVNLPDGSGMVPIEGRSAIVNTDGDVLNVGITKRRAIIQYDHMDDAVEAMLGTGLATGVVSAGTLGHGAKAYVTLEFGDPIDIPGYSKVNRWFTLADGHDGSIAASGRATLGVVVCANTFQSNLIGRPAAWSIRHTTNAELYIGEAVTAFMSAAMEQQAIEKAVERLVNETYAEAEFNSLVKRLVPMPRKGDDTRGRTKCEKRRASMMERYWAPDLDSGIRGTRWGALMAVQGWEQHDSPVNRKTDRESRHVDRLISSGMPLSEKASRILIGATTD